MCEQVESSATDDYAFETWEQEGHVMHCVGLIQFWWYGYTDESSWYDPPRPSAEFTAWLNEHDSSLSNGGPFGPPIIRFASPQDAENFRVAWHEPGVVQRRHYEAWCGSATESTTHEEMDAAMDRAKLARLEWLRKRDAKSLSGEQA